MSELILLTLLASQSSGWDQLIWLTWLVPLTAVVAYPLIARRLLSLDELTLRQKQQLLRALPEGDQQWASQLRVWDTGERICNAAVLGCVPGFSFVMVSDALFRHLSPHGAAAIVAHEVGHMRLWHVPIRLSIVFAGGLLGMAMVHQLEGIEGWQALIQMAVVIGTIGYMSVMLHMVAPLLEFQADFFAVDLLSSRNGTRLQNARVLIRALSQLTLLSGLRPDQKSWLYPSFEQRRRALLGLHLSPCLRNGLRLFLIAVSLSQLTLIVFCICLLAGS
ncbi:M48 family metalloprotease [Bremerella cremea]|uniref:M48 family metalloprotease n=1 Tax=Bremerella cremea TaxID=1031537 RepID=UPI0031F0E3EF